MFSKNSLFGFSIALFLCIFSILYYKYFLEKREHFLLDNPTVQSLKITLNEKEYFLAPGQSVKVKVHNGKNTISTFLNENSNGKTRDTFFIIKNAQRGVINPTHSPYFIFKRHYGYVKNLDSIYKSRKIEIDSKEFLGDIQETNDLFIQDFYFNINQNFPKLINKVDSIEIRSKIFRKMQFLEFYKSKYE